MPKVYFLFGIHNHQPVGNDPFVFGKAFEDCYLPFLDVLKSFPEIKCNVHISGPLYDWAMENKPDYIKDLKEMSDRGQAEIMGGAYYEPILSIISDKDKKAQLRIMNDFIKSKFNKTAKGMWLAERIWEPQLASVISEAGLKYIFLDDAHFRLAGITDKELTGYYTTENSAKPLVIFPINKALRFKIPFSKAGESVDLIKSFAQKGKDVLITLFDDGEKFGSWPTTYDWIYAKGWLKKFFSLLVKNNKTIETVTASEALDKFSSRGLVYLPPASYREMDEWAMEPKEFRDYKEFKDRLRKYPDYQKLRNFIRAGFFRNFFRKYPRANYMHKKMLYLSESANKKTDYKKDKNIFNNLFKAQCNCGYWHGLFGGFYLGNIRAAIYENLIKAEKELDEKYNSLESSAEKLQRGKNKNLIIQKADFDFDGLPEVIIKNKHLIAAFSRRGGTVLELSYKDKNFNLLNTITRREESYHKKTIKQENNKTIKQEIIYDKYERLGLIDHLLDKKITLNNFDKQQKFKTLSGDIYDLDIAEKEKSIALNYQYKSEKLEFTKKISLSDSAEIKVEYDFMESELLKKYNFAAEFNLFFQSFRDVLFYSDKEEIILNKKRVFKKINTLEIFDRFKNIRLRFDFGEADVFIIPIYSISNSQDGPEKMFQQASVLFIKKNKENSFGLRMAIGNL